MKINDEKWSAVAATGVAGIIAGCMTFASAVDARSFVLHVDKKNSDVAKAHFQVWWPCGRDLMVPLVLCAGATHGAAYYCCMDGDPNKVWWAVSGTSLLAIGPYTKLVLGEDIEKLRTSSEEEVAETTIRFCTMHHVRLGLAATAFGLSLIGLSNLRSSN